jgi:hypothetical protein
MPNAGHHSLAKELSVNLAGEVPKFLDHEFKAPKSDADAAFRTWLRNAAGYSDKRFAGGGSRRASAVDVALARVAEHQQGTASEGASIFDDWERVQ